MRNIWIDCIYSWLAAAGLWDGRRIRNNCWEFQSLSRTDHPTHTRISLQFLIEILRLARAGSNVQKLSVNLSVEIGPHTLLGKKSLLTRPQALDIGEKMHGMIRHLKLRFPKIRLTFQKEAWNLDISRQSVTVFIALEMFGDLKKIVKISKDDLHRSGKVWSPSPATAWSVQPYLSLATTKFEWSLLDPSPPLATPSCDAGGEEGFTQFASNDTILISRGNTFEFVAQNWMNDTCKIQRI